MDIFVVIYRDPVKRKAYAAGAFNTRLAAQRHRNHLINDLGMNGNDLIVSQTTLK